MRLKTLCLIPLGLIATGASAESLALEDAAKRLLRDSANTPAPADTSQAVDSVADSVEKAKNLKESMERPQAAPKPPAADSAKAIEKPAPKAAATEPTKKAGKAKSAKKQPPGRSNER